MAVFDSNPSGNMLSPLATQWHDNASLTSIQSSTTFHSAISPTDEEIEDPSQNQLASLDTPTSQSASLQKQAELDSEGTEAQKARRKSRHDSGFAFHDSSNQNDDHLTSQSISRSTSASTTSITVKNRAAKDQRIAPTTSATYLSSRTSSRRQSTQDNNFPATTVTAPSTSTSASTSRRTSPHFESRIQTRSQHFSRPNSSQKRTTTTSHPNSYLRPPARKAPRSSPAVPQRIPLNSYYSSPGPAGGGGVSVHFQGQEQERLKRDLRMQMQYQFFKFPPLDALRAVPSKSSSSSYIDFGGSEGEKDKDDDEDDDDYGGGGDGTRIGEAKRKSKSRDDNWEGSIEMTDASSPAEGTQESGGQQQQRLQRQQQEQQVEEEGEKEATIGQPHAQPIYWTSNRTRRLEYAAIDAAATASRGWRGIMNRLVPGCFHRDGGRNGWKGKLFGSRSGCGCGSGSGSGKSGFYCDNDDDEEDDNDDVDDDNDHNNDNNEKAMGCARWTGIWRNNGNGKAKKKKKKMMMKKKTKKTKRRRNSDESSVRRYRLDLGNEEDDYDTDDEDDGSKDGNIEKNVDIARERTVK